MMNIAIRAKGWKHFYFLYFFKLVPPKCFFCREMPPRQVAASSCLPPTTTLLRPCSLFNRLFSPSTRFSSLSRLCYKRVLTVPQPHWQRLVFFFLPSFYFFLFSLLSISSFVYLIKKTIQPWIKFLSKRPLFSLSLHVVIVVSSRLQKRRLLFFSTKEKEERIPFFSSCCCCCVCCRSSVLESVLNVPNRDGKCRRPHALVCSLAEYFYNRKLSRSPFMTCTA